MPCKFLHPYIFIVARKTWNLGVRKKSSDSKLRTAGNFICHVAGDFDRRKCPHGGGPQNPPFTEFAAPE